MSKLSYKIRVQVEDFDESEENRNLILNRSGALVNFIGTVRGNYTTSENILSLTLEHYPQMTENEIFKIVKKANQRWNVESITVIHRVGKLFPNDKIVYIGVSSQHRQSAFDACNYIIDWLKTNAPFWKSEEFKNKKLWVDERKEDNLALKKWN